MVSTTYLLRHLSRKAGVIFMHEIWKDIPDFNGMYQISNLGNVRSFNKGNSRFHNQECHLIKPTISNTGYCQITLYGENHKRLKQTVHKLVAQAFLSNPNNYPCVNHKDENKLNNNVENLEWCTYAYNNAYGTAKIRTIDKLSIKVEQYTIDGIWIASYKSATIASKLLGIPKTDILSCCHNKIPYAGGYVWKQIT